jgi:bifunctional NMN adenylyltransferase/nudix hydrolase
VRKLTVFIGRFSPFHLGHEEVLMRALNSSEVVLLLIGSSYSARNIKNPFTYDERYNMIYSWYIQNQKYVKGKLVIQPIIDHPYNDQAWIRDVQSEVIKTCAWIENFTGKPYLTGAERDHTSWYLQAFGDFFEKDFVAETRVGFDRSATEIRENLFKGGNDWEYKTPAAVIEFIDGFLKTQHFKDLQQEYNFIEKYKESWKAAPYAPIFSTVDSVVVQSGHVLVITRDAQPGKGLWALPGGFVEQTEKLIDAAVRELIEETSIGLSKAQLYGSISDKEIFDNPGRSLRGRTITTCFLFKLKDNVALPKVKPQAGEVKKVMWVPLAEALYRTENWYEDHHAILETMVSRIKN